MVKKPIRKKEKKKVNLDEYLEAMKPLPSKDGLAELGSHNTCKEAPGIGEEKDEWEKATDVGEEKDSGDEWKEGTCTPKVYGYLLWRAISKVERENTTTLEKHAGVGKCGEIGTGFSFSAGVNVNAIANRLDKEERALFDIEVLRHEAWEKAILYLSWSSNQIMVGKHTLVPELYSTFSINIQTVPLSPCQFTLEFLCDENLLFTCRAEDMRLRDEIVVIGKACQMRSTAEPCRAWIKPIKGWLKLNIDIVRAGSASGIGGLVRDEEGKWYVGFWGKGTEATMPIELNVLALKEGLSSLEEGHKKMKRKVEGIIIESPSKDLENVIENGTYEDLKEPFHTAAYDCKRLLKKLGVYKFRYIEPDVGASLMLALKGSLLHKSMEVKKAFDVPSDVRDLRLILHGDSKDQPSWQLELIKGTSTAARYSVLVTRAIRKVEEDIEITLENDVGVTQCGKVGTDFSVSVINRDAIADRLKKEQASFDIEVHLGKVWKMATIYISWSSIQIVVGKQPLVPEVYTTLNFLIKLQKDSPCQFTLEFPCDKSLRFTCRAKEVSIRDEVMVTGKAFQLKSSVYPYRDWIKPINGWLKLNLDIKRGGRGFGGVVRDEMGNWMVGFWGKGPVEATQVELYILALKEGLLALDEDKCKTERPELVIETTCEDLERVLEDETYNLQKLFRTAASECKLLLGKLGKCKFRFIEMDVGVAFMLAFKGCKLPSIRLDDDINKDNDEMRLEIAYDAPHDVDNDIRNTVRQDSQRPYPLAIFNLCSH